MTPRWAVWFIAVGLPFVIVGLVDMTGVGIVERVVMALSAR